MANKKKKNRKRNPWNKGLEMGQRDPFKALEVARIKAMLAKRGNAGLRDLALFSTAIDTMLSAPNLLGLTVKDVRKRNRVMRDTLELALDNRGQSIRCTLSDATMSWALPPVRRMPQPPTQSTPVDESVRFRAGVTPLVSNAVTLGSPVLNS